MESHASARSALLRSLLSTAGVLRLLRVRLTGGKFHIITVGKHGARCERVLCARWPLAAPHNANVAQPRVRTNTATSKVTNQENTYPQ